VDRHELHAAGGDQNRRFSFIGLELPAGAEPFREMRGPDAAPLLVAPHEIEELLDVRDPARASGERGRDRPVSRPVQDLGEERARRHSPGRRAPRPQLGSRAGHERRLFAVGVIASGGRQELGLGHGPRELVGEAPGFYP
jgi:hypothetical protein